MQSGKTKASRQWKKSSELQKKKTLTFRLRNSDETKMEQFALNSKRHV